MWDYMSETNLRTKHGRLYCNYKRNVSYIRLHKTWPYKHEPVLAELKVIMGKVAREGSWTLVSTSYWASQHCSKGKDNVSFKYNVEYSHILFRENKKYGKHFRLKNKCRKVGKMSYSRYHSEEVNRFYLKLIKHIRKLYSSF